MSDIGFPDSAESIIPPNQSAPRDIDIETTSNLGAVAQVLYFLGQRLLYSLLVLLAIIFLVELGAGIGAYMAKEDVRLSR